MFRKNGVVIAVAVVITTACAPDPEPAEACPAPTEAPDLSALPPDLDLPRWGTVTRVATGPKGVAAEAIATTTIVELYPPLARHVLESYDIISSENEGFEAEIFFARGKITGAFRLREGPCAGDVTIKLLYAEKKDG
jgi:hypothetical protein